MHKPSAQIASIHQESVDYALLVLRETTRQLFLLDVPFSQILKTLGEVNEQERSDVHATPVFPTGGVKLGGMNCMGISFSSPPPTWLTQDSNSWALVCRSVMSMTSWSHVSPASATPARALDMPNQRDPLQH
jgi:hypothetical protein